LARQVGVDPDSPTQLVLRITGLDEITNSYHAERQAGSRDRNSKRPTVRAG